MKRIKSIREFVSESELIFQLYLGKYSNQLKRIEDKDKIEIIEKFEKDRNRKVRKFKKDLTREKFKDDISQNAIKLNIDYLNNLKPPINKNIIIANFNKEKERYLKTLTKESEIKKIKGLELTSDISTERLGEVLMLLIKNLATKPSFIGYSDSWKEDFIGDAIEKTILYINNFDENLVSKRTGKKSKAFAYVTQIAFNSFINVINIRKKYSNFLKKEIANENINFEGIKNHMKEEKGSYNLIKSTESIFEKEIYSNSDFIKLIKYIDRSNEIIKLNDLNDFELELLDNIPENERTKDYFNYKKEIEDKLIKTFEKKLINTIIIYKEENIILDNIKTDYKIIIKQKIKKIDIFEEWYKWLN